MQIDIGTKIGISTHKREYNVVNWYKQASRTIEQHVKDVVNADLESPIFVTEEYEIIDGAHRTCKAYLLEQPIECIVLTQDDLEPTLLPDDSDYVGQIYRDDDHNEYSVTNLIELYGDRKTTSMDPKVIIGQSENVWGKEVDIYDILKKAKKKMEKSSKAKKEGKFLFSLDVMWQEITKNFSNINTKVSLPKKIGSINDMEIYLVDGDEVKKSKNMDFVEGGNDEVYDFIPERQIWIDDNMSPKVMPHIIYHEYLERYLMNKYDMMYDDAHDIANSKEREKINRAAGINDIKWVKNYPKGREYVPKCDCKDENCPICQKKKKDLNLKKPMPRLAQSLKKRFVGDCIRGLNNDVFRNNVAQDATELAQIIEKSTPLALSRFLEMCEVDEKFRERIFKSKDVFETGQYQNIIWLWDTNRDRHYFYI